MPSSKYRLALACVLAAAGAAIAGSASGQPAISAPPAGKAAPEPLPALKLILVGDSTTAVLSGWGGAFCSRHVTMWVSCVDMARNGRSSTGYIRDGSWQLAQAEMRVPGYRKVLVLIQFGHNDQPGHPGQQTNFETEFPTNIERYVRETRMAGATPVLVTPLTRRGFVEGTLDNTLAPWAAAIQAIAKRMNVPLVDLNAESAAIASAMGPTLANRFAMGDPSAEQSAAALDGTPDPRSSPSQCKCGNTSGMSAAGTRPRLGEADHYFDIAHLGPRGADFFASLIARDLARDMPELRPWLVLEN
jgi:lysophospholipase L1-like esterase